MLLDRIDIDAHGPLKRVELGPFAEHLNAVCGPEGSGKTAIARFVRDSLVSRDYPLGMLSSSAGRVVWADRNGLLHCRREKDGTSSGRRTIEFESRGDFDRHFASLDHSWISDVAASTDSSRAVHSIQLPESIVDGVVTDTAVSSVARVVSACVRSGLDSHETYRSLPLCDESIYRDRDGYGDVVQGHNDPRFDHHPRLREQLAEVEAELSRLGNIEADQQTLLDRRNWLTVRLARPHRSKPVRHRYDASHHADWQQRLTQLHDRARQLRARQSELRRWIAEIDGDGVRTRYATQANPAQYQHRAATSDENLQRQLDDLDAQMIRWRRALLEVRGLRNAFLSSQGYFETHPFTPLDDASLRRVRLDGFLQAIDRYDRSNFGARPEDRPRSWDDYYPEAYRPLHRIDDIDQRIESATRQIDWLLERYDGSDKVQYAWYETSRKSVNYTSGTTLGETLRAIREDLRQVQRGTLGGPGQIAYRQTSELEELRRSEQWLMASIEQLNRHRESLLHTYTAANDCEVKNWSRDKRSDPYVLDRERGESIAELERVTSELDACLSQAAEVRRSTRSLPVIDSQWYDERSEYDWVDRDALVAELRGIDDRLASMSRFQWLQSQRSQLQGQLRVVRRPAETKSPLADAASHWLVRLSAGRLQRIGWPLNRFRDNQNAYHRDSRQRTGVTINGRDETQCPAADRALAAMAVRMAAGDLLAQTGRQVPLIFETHAEMFSNVVPYDRNDVAPLAYYQHGNHLRSNHPIAAALGDYSRSGRQVVVLTSNQDFAGQLSRVGARTFQIHAQKVVHAHRPIWQPQYETEHYVGPHPHTYGPRDAEEVFGYDRHAVDPTSARSHAPRVEHPVAPIVDINRDFDMAWREAYGFYDNPDRVAPTSRRTDWARDGVDFRDGYYFANTYTTANPDKTSQYDQGHRVHESFANGTATTATQASAAVSATQNRPLRSHSPASPFFLSVDSPIDQAPSIDAVAAARLRGLNVTHVNHLMQHDPNRLADALGLANVDAATIRRWQAECRLVCRVPQLRGFDARVLVGCGVATPAQLASIHPVDLLQEVEAFLATERGQQILLSGSSHELSRITSWIAAANSSSDHDLATFKPNRKAAHTAEPRSGRRSYYRGFDDPEYAYDSDGYEYGPDDDNSLERNTDSRRRRRRNVRTMNESDAAHNSNGRSRRGRSDNNSRGTGTGQRARSASGSGSGSGNGSGSGHGNGTPNRSSRRGNGNGRGTGNGGGYGSGNGNRRSSGGGQGEGEGTGYGGGSGSGRTRRRRTDRSSTDRASGDREIVQYEPERTEREPREPRAAREPRESRERASRERQEVESQELRFYLHRENPVADAPSIGSRMSDRLNAIGIYTVDDLLNADPDTVASELNHRRVDVDTVVAWQQQATLVCRVPMLRGHDAQLLVLADVTTPEELAVSDAEDLLGIVDPVARSSEGKRIVRGGKLPDLEEVTDWIGYAQHKRELLAA